MTDYGELVKALRICVNTAFCNECPLDDTCENANKLQLDAADAIELLLEKYYKAERDATNLTGRLAQAEADIDRLNLEIDKRIATEIELSNSLDAANFQLKMYSMCSFDDEED